MLKILNKILIESKSSQNTIPKSNGENVLVLLTVKKILQKSPNCYEW